MTDNPFKKLNDALDETRPRMDRPTKEEVDEVLRAAQSNQWKPGMRWVLLEEVLALREELAGQRNAFARLLVDYEALKRAGRDHPRYDTAAVDALAEAWYDWDVDGGLETVRNRMDAVIASREPPL